MCAIYVGYRITPPLANKIIKRPNWYKSLFVDDNHTTYPDNVWYREHLERNFDIVNLGSSSAKFAFNYDGLPIKAMNWAQAPQTLTEDFILLKGCHSILRKNGIVLITILPFTGINKPVTAKSLMRYIPNLHPQAFNGQPLKDEAYKLYDNPLLFGKPAIKAIIKYLLGKDTPAPKAIQPSTQPMNSEQLEADAQRGSDGWKAQFNIQDLDAPLTAENQEGRKVRVKLMQDLIDFCKERSYRPVYVIPPVTSHLQKRYTHTFINTYITSYLEEVDRHIPILDYTKDEELTNDSLYFNSFFLNTAGAKQFTSRVVTDLQQL